MPVNRVVVGVVAALLLAAMGTPLAAAAEPPAPKVVIVVGPSGAATDRYRSEAREAAALARRYTTDVTELYSPDATWPAVRRALQGASLVIYMGHGNGWPSKYRDSLYPASQNGFGLNPSEGSGDSAHQYFGEARIAAEIELAKNAVVLLNHLCYASGLSEPGLPEGTPEQARQRVDNFAAGFIRAGAAAVIAEAYDDPGHMIRAVLGGGRSIEAAWRGAPRANGHAFAFDSARSPGHVVLMDPERNDAGFSRSIVLKAGLASADVLRDARGSRTGGGSVDPPPAVPSLVRAGVRLGTPSIAGLTLAGGQVFYKIPFTIDDRSNLPETVKASARWALLDVDQGTADPESTGPDFGLVTAERLGDVVEPVDLRITRTRMAVHVATPATAGRYRLTVTLHDADGVAYDAETQARIPALVVRVTGEHDAGIDAPARLEASPGDSLIAPVWVANLGRDAWGGLDRSVWLEPGGREDDPLVAATRQARLTGTWLALGDDATVRAAADAASVTTVALPVGLGPGAVVAVDLTLIAPTAPGAYLVILDVVTPEVGSLAALGVGPTIIRVEVVEPGR